MINTNTTLVSKRELLDYVSKREFNDFVEDMRDFRAMTESRFDVIDERFVAIDQRFDAIDQRFVAIDQKFDAIEKRFDGADIRLSGIDKRFIGLERKIDKLEDSFRIQVGVVLEQFKEHMQINREYMQGLETRLMTKIQELEDKIS